MCEFDDCTLFCGSWMDKEIVSIGQPQSTFDAAVCLFEEREAERNAFMQEIVCSLDKALAVTFEKNSFHTVTDVFIFDLRQHTLSIPNWCLEEYNSCLKMISLIQLFSILLQYFCSSIKGYNWILLIFYFILIWYAVLIYCFDLISYFNQNSITYHLCTMYFNSGKKAVCVQWLDFYVVKPLKRLHFHEFNLSTFPFWTF